VTLGRDYKRIREVKFLVNLVCNCGGWCESTGVTYTMMGASQQHQCRVCKNLVLSNRTYPRIETIEYEDTIWNRIKWFVKVRTNEPEELLR
jgi:hypothetical protein